MPMPAPAWFPDSVPTALLQLLAMAVLEDFGLYWGHRVQHEVPSLWRIHRMHHSIDTPTPWSTLYIHRTDAILQGSLPMLFAVMVLRPLPGVIYVSYALRVAENALNHTGLDHWLVNLLTLKSLPLRAQAAHHDAHHKYSNYAGHAKNYGETFWVWDWLFGTGGKACGMTQGALAQAAKAA